MTGIQALEQKTLLYDSVNCRPRELIRNQPGIRERHVQSQRDMYLGGSWRILIGQIVSANIIEKNNKRPKKMIIDMLALC